MSASPGLVDIIIVNLDGRRYLEKCLASVALQCRREPYRLVIIDNGSSDGSVAWARASYPSALMIQNETNAGFAKACNQGIRATNGEYILLLNNDTEFLNDVLAVFLDFFQTRGGIGLVGPLTLYPDHALQASIKHFPPVWKFVIHQLGLSFFLRRDQRLYYPFGPFDPLAYSQIREVEWLGGACLLFHRSLTASVGLLDENMPFGMEDMDYGRRVIKAGLRNFFLPAAKIVHYQGGSYQNGTARKRQAFVHRSYSVGIRRYYRKHYSRAAYLLVQASMMLGNLVRLMGRRFT